MRKKEYKFNPQTLTYEPVERPKRLKRFLLIRRTLLFLLASLVINMVYSLAYYTPKLRKLQTRGERIVGEYNILASRMSSTEQKIASLKQRDNNVYRSLFGADTLKVAGIYTSYSKDIYEGMNDDYNGIVASSWQTLDALTREVYRQSLSLDELQQLSTDKEQMTTAIPAMSPSCRMACALIPSSSACCTRATTSLARPA